MPCGSVVLSNGLLLRWLTDAKVSRNRPEASRMCKRLYGRPCRLVHKCTAARRNHLTGPSSNRRITRRSPSRNACSRATRKYPKYYIQLHSRSHHPRRRTAVLAVPLRGDPVRITRPLIPTKTIDLKILGTLDKTCFNCVREVGEPLNRAVRVCTLPHNCHSQRLP